MSLKECCACGGPVELPDAHDACVFCLGRAHAEAALDGPDFPSCEEMSVKTLRARISAVLNCAPANPLPPPPVAVEPREERTRQPRAVGPSDERMSTQFLHAHHSREPPLLDTPISPLDLFGDAVGSFSEKFLDEPFLAEERSVRGASATFQVLFFTASKKAGTTAAYSFPYEGEGGPGAGRETQSEAVPESKEDGTPSLWCWARSTAAFLTGLVRGGSGRPERWTMGRFAREFVLLFFTCLSPRMLQATGGNNFPQSRVMSRVPFLSGALQGASPTRPLSLSTSVPPAHTGGPTGAEDVYDAPRVVGSFLS
ncbi:hypothetical protein G5714_007374 [Onychostoma macrolepis]|uniref:Uncharacterized protein n=1 Tax=Onychostoma macrolepis TaxID=369639 RepID=A0A7J6D060_9TELE|nr:hypothetical protein G5714_007374 [Onychostoma macrolepis]